MAPAFVPFSTFVPRNSLPAQTRATSAAGSPRRVVPTCVAPRHVRRAEEIKRLTQQLEELRAARARLGSDQSTTASAPDASPAPEAPASSPPPPPPPPPVPGAVTAQRPASLGQHSSGSRFLSISSIGSEERIPRILPVVGHIPGLSASVFTSVPNVTFQGSTEPGCIHVTDVSRTPFPVLAIESSDALSACADPVCVSIDAARVSAARLPVADGGSVVLIVDRDVAGEKLSDTNFYAWDVDGRVEVGWVTEIPPESEMRLIGRVAYGVVEVDSELRQRRSSWEEENETYA